MLTLLYQYRVVAEQLRQAANVLHEELPTREEHEARKRLVGICREVAANADDSIIFADYDSEDLSIYDESND